MRFFVCKVGECNWTLRLESLCNWQGLSHNVHATPSPCYDCESTSSNAQTNCMCTFALFQNESSLGGHFGTKKNIGACAMTNFSTIKFSLSKFYCHDVSNEKKRFGQFSSLPPCPPPPLKSANLIFIVVWLSLNLAPRPKIPRRHPPGPSAPPWRHPPCWDFQ